jgi:hypothetical protein
MGKCNESGVKRCAFLDDKQKIFINFDAVKL